MRIAVVDVAAEKGGALTVLQDFLRFVQSESCFCQEQEWFFYTSKDIGINDKRIRSIVVPKVKKSWFHRLYWEKRLASKEFQKEKIDVVISLQNTAVVEGNYKQIVYFHNVLLLENPKKYSFFKASERKLALYTKVVSKFTLKSLKKANYIICQTEAVKQSLLVHNPSFNVCVIPPNYYVERKYMNTASFPIEGVIYPVSANPYKRIEELIEAVQRYYEWFVKHNFKILITLTGNENKYSKTIKKKTKGLEEIITFTGFLKREELLELYKKYCLFICSELESLCLPLVEASVVGTAIVAANYPYAKEVTDGINNAFLYTPGNIEELMDRISKVSKLKTVKYNKMDFHENTWSQIIPFIKESKED